MHNNNKLDFIFHFLELAYPVEYYKKGIWLTKMHVRGIYANRLIM
jgi:hypothetical protein